MVMGAEKFHNQPSASWGTRTAGGIIPSASEGMVGMGSGDGVSPGLRPKARETGTVISTGRRGMPPLKQRMSSSFLCLLVQSRPSRTGRSPPTLMRAILFPHPASANADLVQTHPHRHTQKECLTSFLGTPQPSQADTEN